MTKAGRARAGLDDPRQGGSVIPRRIAFINEKGGSGKTTLVANIAAHLAGQRGYPTLAIDMDPQGQLGKVLGVEVRRPEHSAIELLVSSLIGGEGGEGGQGRERGEPPRAAAGRASLPAVATRIPHLDLIVGNKSLALFPAWTESTGEDATQRLREKLDDSPDLTRYDFVLFDAPPSFGPLTLNILCACDEVVVPCPLTFLALDGCAELMRTIAMVRQRYERPRLRVSMVIPTFYRRTRLANEILEKLKSHFPKEIAHTVVGYHVKLDEAQSRGLSIFEYAPRDRGAATMAALAEELLERGRPELREAARPPASTSRHAPLEETR